jgi:hypothetical protein
VEQVTFTKADGERIARRALSCVRNQFNAGQLSSFARGMAQGRMNLVYTNLPLDLVALQGIDNEINYLCRRACRSGQ